MFYSPLSIIMMHFKSDHFLCSHQYIYCGKKATDKIKNNLNKRQKYCYLLNRMMMEVRMYVVFKVKSHNCIVKKLSGNKLAFLSSAMLHYYVCSCWSLETLAVHNGRPRFVILMLADPPVHNKHNSII